MSYNIDPIENFSPLRHTNLVAEAVGEVVGDMLTHLTVPSNPYRIDLATVGTSTSYSIALDIEEVSTGSETNYISAFTSTGTETLDELYVAMAAALNTRAAPIHSTANIDYTSDSDKYLTITTNEGYRITSPPVPSAGLILDTSTKVQASNGKPASFGAHQHVLDLGYPKLIVTQLPLETVNENWRNGSVLKNLNDGNGDQYFPYYDRYIRASYQVTCEAGSVSDVLQNGLPDSGQILEEFLSRMREDNTRIGFFNKVDGTLNRDFTVSPIPSVSYTQFQDMSVMNFSLDYIVRKVEYRGNIITRVEVVGQSDSVPDGARLEDREGNQVNPVDFGVQAPSHP